MLADVRRYHLLEECAACLLAANAADHPVQARRSLLQAILAAQAADAGRSDDGDDRDEFWLWDAVRSGDGGDGCRVVRGGEERSGE